MKELCGSGASARCSTAPGMPSCSQPCFGYGRGRYTAEELRRIDELEQPLPYCRGGEADFGHEPMFFNNWSRNVTVNTI